MMGLTSNQTSTNTCPAPSGRGLPLPGATSPALPTAGHEGGQGGRWHQAGLQSILLATMFVDTAYTRKVAFGCNISSSMNLSCLFFELL